MAPLLARHDRPPASSSRQFLAQQLRGDRGRRVQSGMNPHTPSAPVPLETAPAEITETQAFTRAWVVFLLLFLGVLALLWASDALFG